MIISDFFVNMSIKLKKNEKIDFHQNDCRLMVPNLSKRFGLL